MCNCLLKKLAFFGKFTRNDLSQILARQFFIRSAWVINNFKVQESFMKKKPNPARNHDSKKMLQDIQNNVRLGCGAGFGLFFGISIAVQFSLSSLSGWAIVLLVCIVVCAWLSRKFGDRFWHFMSAWRR